MKGKKRLKWALHKLYSAHQHVHLSLGQGETYLERKAAYEAMCILDKAYDSVADRIYKLDQWPYSILEDPSAYLAEVHWYIKGCEWELTRYLECLSFGNNGVGYCSVEQQQSALKLAPAELAALQDALSIIEDADRNI